MGYWHRWLLWYGHAAALPEYVTTLTLGKYSLSSFLMAEAFST